mmetsp:Transcript_176506/g.565913  ORF Transcript_176506/g.565913 Transcript_176506/m.565913 type:complete len:242 (-) Transcript_176506:73-798(-)
MGDPTRGIRLHAFCKLLCQRAEVACRSRTAILFGLLTGIAQGGHLCDRCNWGKCRLDWDGLHRHIMFIVLFGLLTGIAQGGHLCDRCNWGKCRLDWDGLHRHIMFIVVCWERPAHRSPSSQRRSIGPHDLRLQGNLRADTLQGKHCEGLLDLDADVLHTEEAEREQLLCEDDAEAQRTLQCRGEQQKPRVQEAGGVLGVAERDWSGEDVLARAHIVDQSSNVVLHEDSALIVDSVAHRFEL